MTDKLKDFVSTFQKQKKPKIITVADDMKRINKNEIGRVYYANKTLQNSTHSGKLPNLSANSIQNQRTKVKWM